jgi:probable phosphoglycerate mutase
MKQLYFARHGESEGNTACIYASRTHVPLTGLGREQADVAGKQAAHDGLHFDLMLVSPLKRAHETADILAPIIGNPPRESYDDIMERDFSPLDGSSYKNRTFEMYLALDKTPGVESTKALQQRAERVFDYLKTRPEDSILLVSHSAFGRALRRVVENRPWQDEYLQDGNTSLPHAEIVRFI